MMSEKENQSERERAHRALLDELYYVKDVAGEREQQISRLKARIDEQERAIAKAHAEIQHILQSRSWRLTAPLRLLATLFSRARRRKTQLTSVTPSLGGALQTSISSLEPLDEIRRGERACLLLDVTELVLRSGQTGIQRVVREVLRELQADPPENYLVVPIYAPPGQPYRYARVPVAEELSEQGGVVSGGSAVAFRPGDVFLGLDHSMSSIVEHASELEELKRQSVGLYFICYDLLPMKRPDWFPPEVHPLFKRWIETVAHIASGVICISHTVENELRGYLAGLQISREQPLMLGHFHLGTEMGPHQVLDTASEVEQNIGILRGRISFLMVGTIEPRKGHAQALEAFEYLWALGHSVTLVLVGCPGWMTEVTVRRIRHHSEFGKRLFWFTSASDELLAALYATCTVLLAASEGEGFGLPLIEAAQHGMPIICRDLAVFREVVGDNAAYFSGTDAESLAAAIQKWLLLLENGAAPGSEPIRWLDWKESAQQLLDVMFNGKWDGSWHQRS